MPAEEGVRNRGLAYTSRLFNTVRRKVDTLSQGICEIVACTEVREMALLVCYVVLIYIIIYYIYNYIYNSSKKNIYVHFFIDVLASAIDLTLERSTLNRKLFDADEFLRFKEENKNHV